MIYLFIYQFMHLIIKLFRNCEQVHVVSVVDSTKVLTLYIFRGHISVSFLPSFLPSFLTV